MLFSLKQLRNSGSFIAVHDVIRNPEGQSEKVDQPLPMPLNVSNLAVGFSVSSVPEPEMYILLIIAGLILSMIFIYKNIIRRHAVNV